MKSCALCLQLKPLKKSHVIPNAIFKRIFRANNGRAITFSDDKLSPIDRSSDSWWEYLLCETCEPMLNYYYEKYSLALLRGDQGMVVRHDCGVTFSGADFDKLLLFLISIYWRAAVSTHKSYSKVYIPEPWRSQIRESILKNCFIPLRLATVKISRLIDTTASGFSLDDLKSLIVTPFFRRVSGGFSFCFLIEGFFIEIFTPGLTYKNRGQKGILNPRKNVLFIPYLSIFDIPELVELMVSAYGKHVEGNSNIKVNKSFKQTPLR